MANRVWAWLAGPSDITSDSLTPLRADDALASAMSQAAAAFAARNQLDFSTESLRLLDRNLEAASTVEMGAYLGEVILRSEPAMRWARTERGEPGIAAGAWLADPFAQVERARRNKAATSSAEFAATIATVASAESTDDGGHQAGLRTKRLTQWEQLVKPGRRRHRKMRRP